MKRDPNILRDPAANELLGGITGYNQSVTDRGSQRRQFSCYSTKTHVNSMIFILKLNLTLLRNIYIKSGLR